MYCAAGLKPALESIAAQYTKEVGLSVHFRYEGSGELLSSLVIHPEGDLYIPADSSYADDARSKGLVVERFDLATQQPVLAVAAGNPSAKKPFMPATRPSQNCL